MLRRALPIRAASAATLAFALVGISAPVTQAGQPKAQTSADDVTELTQITSAYLQKRADSVTAAGAQQRALSAPADVTRTLASELEDDFAALADQGRILREVNGGYTRAEVDVTPGQTNVEGDIATLEVTEDTRLYYPNVEEGDPEYEEYSLPHTLTFKRSADGDWLLAGDRAEVDPAGPAPTTQLTDPMSEPAPDSEDEGAKEPGAASDPAGAPARDTVYVGDHPANDTFPAARAGLRTVHRVRVRPRRTGAVARRRGDGRRPALAVLAGLPRALRGVAEPRVPRSDKGSVEAPRRAVYVVRIRPRAGGGELAFPGLGRPRPASAHRAPDPGGRRGVGPAAPPPTGPDLRECCAPGRRCRRRRGPGWRSASPRGRAGWTAPGSR
ncbi:hypothetical protein SBADM41S_05679 [Streptomyces badius]